MYEDYTRKTIKLCITIIYSTIKLKHKRPLHGASELAFVVELYPPDLYVLRDDVAG